MPVIKIEDYNWRQTLNEIIITMPIRGNSRKIDILAIDNYVKASYPPFILELFLFNNIVEEESQCTLDETSAIFTLKKAEAGSEWPTLLCDGLTKEKKQQLRMEAIERAQLSAERRKKEEGEKRGKLQRRAVRKQIELDTEVLNKIESIRDNHRKEAMTEFENWRVKDEKPILHNNDGVIQTNRKEYRTPIKWFNGESNDIKITENGNNNRLSDEKQAAVEVEDVNSNSKDKLNDKKNYSLSAKNVNNSEQFTTWKKQLGSVDQMTKKEIQQIIEDTKEKESRRGKEIIDRLLSGKCRTFKQSIFDSKTDSIPMPRLGGTINVTFSERVFPTPARESAQLEEEEWLQKQAEARRKCGFASEDLRPEEQDPQWLKDKGDEFFKAGNYIAAVSAYTHGIKLSDKMTSLYANRAAAHYALENYRRCAEDCSTALELMIPKCEGNRESRARCHARLGAALCKLSAPQHGIPELEAALKLAPDNDTIKCDLNEAKAFFNIYN